MLQVGVSGVTWRPLAFGGVGELAVQNVLGKKGLLLSLLGRAFVSEKQEGL